MLSNIIHNPAFSRFWRDFHPGEVIFFEDDESQDLFLLAEGQVEVLKGQAVISQISQPGSIFGEMSYLLGSRRTATVRALGQVKVLRIPSDDIEPLIQQFPELSLEFTRLLAHRLEHTSQALHGLQEFCDLLADAVIFTNEHGRVLAHNRAAEDLYGCRWPAGSQADCAEDDGSEPKSLQGDAAQMFADPQALKDLLDKVRSKKQIREALLQVRHPLRGALWVSASLTALYDPRQGFQGVLLLARDVTAAEKMRRTVRRLRNWLLPVLLLLAGATAGLYLWQPQLFSSIQVLDARQQSLGSQLFRDYLLLQAQLVQPVYDRDMVKVMTVLKDFMAQRDHQAQPLLGLVLLDKGKEVLGGLSAEGRELTLQEVGATYAHIRFQGDEKSAHRLLTLYRRDNEHPQGRRDLEMAFELNMGQEQVGWLVFQLDPKALKSRYDLDEKDLKVLRIP